MLGSGSDYTVFFNHLGVASTDLVFDGPYGVYHSVYDTYAWMATQGDPGFRYHAAMAKYAGLLALRFANADLLPFDAAAYGREIARYAAAWTCLPGSKPLRRGARGSRREGPRRGASRRPPRRRRWPGAFVSLLRLRLRARDRERLASLARALRLRRRGAFRSGPGSAT